MCRLFGYSKQAYYKHLTRKQRQAWQWQSGRSYVLQLRSQMPRLGVRKLYHMLAPTFKNQQIHIGRDKLFDLLRQEDLLVKKHRRYTKTTNSRHWMKKYPNLIRHVELTRPEQVWVSDITYIPVEKGFNYLHLITDAYSKQIMGYELSKNLAASSSIKALKMALGNRRYNEALVHHSDRGLQYCSSAYTQIYPLITYKSA